MVLSTSAAVMCGYDPTGASDQSQEDGGVPWGQRHVLRTEVKAPVRRIELEGAEPIDDRAPRHKASGIIISHYHYTVF